MPLQSGSSQETIGENIAELINAGHDPQQAAAIAYKKAEDDEAQGQMIFYSDKISDNLEETPEGFLICRNVSLARTGLMEYQNTGQIDGNNNPTVMIGHNRETLSSEETISSFEGKSITLEHPPEMLNPFNTTQYTQGHIQNVHFDEESQTLKADLVIITAESIELVKNGLREVSCGYWADVKPNGDGTGTLVNVVGNHLALVANGRCGSKCSINDNREITMTEKETLFKKIAALFDSSDKKDDDTTAEDDADMFDAKSSFDALAKRMDDLEAKIAPAKKDDDDEEGEASTPSKEDQILSLLNKLLEMESKEQENTDDDDDDDDDDEDEGDPFGDSLKIKIDDSAYADSAFKTPSIAELNAKYAKHFGGK